MVLGITGDCDYRLIEVPSDQVDREMRIAGESSGIPQVLQGLWWMDGNPAPDEVLSLGGSTWEPESRMTRIRVYGERVWSWHSNVFARVLYAHACTARLDYELRFDEALRLGTITPILHHFRGPVRVPQALIKLTMRYQRDGLWRRETRLLGFLHHAYDLRRIVRADGTREDAFAEYVASAPARSLLAVRRQGT